jgi:hypothetical protein
MFVDIWGYIRKYRTTDSSIEATPRKVIRSVLAIAQSLQEAPRPVLGHDKLPMPLTAPLAQVILLTHTEVENWGGHTRRS